MMHECIIESYIVGGDGTISYGEGIVSVCGFKALSYSGRADNALYDVIQADAELRLPLNVKIGMRDRVTLTKSFGTELDPVLHFEVSDMPDSFGPSGHVVRLKEVFV